MNEDLVLILYQFFNAKPRDERMVELCMTTLNKNLCLKNKCGNCVWGRQFYARHPTHNLMNQWRDTCEPIIIRNTTGIL